MAGNMLQEFLIAEDKEPVKPLPPISHQWRPPELNQYKVNFDAAVFRTTNSAGIGVIVRDWRGELGALWLTPSLIWRLWQAEFGLQTVVFEGDSTMVINAIDQGNAGFSTYGNVIEDIRCQAVLFQSSVFNHVNRSCNCVAVALAKKAKRGWGPRCGLLIHLRILPLFCYLMSIEHALLILAQTSCLVSQKKKV
ncbi:uncharacterized protein LOC115959727 [Quercus lobata]|uniref:uncharacterized protein LOC115959727 n=1 Tax=Quercus lobata TaxID=97700 RepID=UPI00124557F5|nr:uncharacterized protein LOC115959727 [Quercus lobata]